ncbi:capping protein inhibiting regulator of actin dynamics isoform X2 [Brienomyrus brachyistius]|uniref:capping protein inhibiting regulator of actin dynamics isoform X2 n=1 Tax=Brienomyrus brachyistius TaxID=42636 RepID=UPI0020B22FAA|nr:capping protein inhibiting regulator of actin dynamics isoform X2 [Brienomyrus brachyistius]
MATNANDADFEVTLPESAEHRQQGKFQPFKRLFRKKKKRESAADFEEAGIKCSQSTGDVTNGIVSDDEETNQHLRAVNTLGSRAFSHESIFICEETSRIDTMSQENVSDKVRDLQRQIAQNIKFGQKLSSPRKSEDAGDSSDEEEAPGRPLQVLAQVEVEPVGAAGAVQPAVLDRAEGGTQTTVLKSPRTKRAIPPAGTIESINLDAVPLSLTCLDSTAAKHKLSIKPKNQRISRKHRRFTQDLQEVSTPGVLQEDIEPQAPGDGGGSTLKCEEPLWSEDELPIGSPDKSKKPKLNDEAQLLEDAWAVEERQTTRTQEVLEENRKTEVRELRNMEEDHQRKAEELRLQKEKKRKEEREEMESRSKEEKRRIKSEEEVKRQQELEVELLNLEKERKLIEEEERRTLRDLEEQSRQQREVQRQDENRIPKKDDKEQKLEEKRRINEVELLSQDKERQKREQNGQGDQPAERSKLSVKVASQEEGMARTKVPAEDTADSATWKQKAEELRWKEMDEKQRPFTFKVSSGEKQILFQRVNLSPVTPSRPQGNHTDFKETKTLPTGTGDSPVLPCSLFVPHTAILVTGAQLCGAAVNLDQIKDPACKSLLGLTEDKKAISIPLSKGPVKTSAERKSGKTKSLNESSADQSSSAMLAEWASIRSKIFKRTENGDDPDQSLQHQNQPPSEDPSQKSLSGVHGNLRKTMSVNAKFSITPARQKFPDSSRASEEEQQKERQGGQAEPSSDTGVPLPDYPTSEAQNRTSKTVRILDRTEGCMFAKDLPSFLVPSPPQSSLRSRSQSEAGNPVLCDSGWDGKPLSSEDKASPFGVKLRRTNYSLRFRSEQPVEKRKKRYSAGDSFDGIPSPLTPIDPDSSEKSSPSSPLRDGITQLGYTGVTVESKVPADQAPVPAMRGDSERHHPRQLHSKPAIAPKPCSSSTPPPSPQVKGQAAALSAAATASTRQGSQEQDSSTGLLAKARLEEEGPKERKSFFPSISIPWREKGDRRVEAIKREKPFLQSRHSLDSGRVEQTGPHVTEHERQKEKEAGPLWITLALQKQKGFRDQQQSREDRRQMREARLAEKQSKEEQSGCSSPESREGSSIGSDGGGLAQKGGECDRAGGVLGLFERREQLRKANTLPSSVDAADPTPAAPPAKDAVKRFPCVESAQVCTEPAWLALAKRKAKAWSDCPQIIK